jgi:hypothetical protein
MHIRGRGRDRCHGYLRQIVGCGKNKLFVFSR